MSQPTLRPLIRRGFSGATFIQMWRMRSAHDQKQWLRAMHRNIHLLQKQLGFVSMSLHASLDGTNIVVYAQWNSEAELQAAVDISEVKAAREELDSHGEPDGTLFKVDSVYLSVNGGVGADETLAIEPTPDRLVFVNIWTVLGKEQQSDLLSAMKEEAPAMVAKPGSRGMALHRSLDGRRIAVYAAWESMGAFESAMTQNSEAQEGREQLRKFGEYRANTYRVDSVHLPLV